MALISTIQEINAIYPSSKWDRVDTLTAALERVERTRLIRLLGQQLFDRIVQDYGRHMADHDHFLYGSKENTEPLPESRFILDVIRTCQEIELYITLSNNVRILSSSLNRGGGFNMMEADNYSTPDDKQFSALKTELWRNAMDSSEHLLLLLEGDAQGDQVYTDLWKKSRYYYMHSDLLITTAVDMQHYMDISESRDRYIQMMPVIRNCQDIYIATRIGMPMLNALVKMQNDIPDEDEQPAGMAAVLRTVKQALAQYVASEAKDNTDLSRMSASGMSEISKFREMAHLNGDRLIGLAIQQILSDADSYAQFIGKGSPLAFEYQQANGEEYHSPAEREALAEAQEALLPQAYSECQCTRDDKEYDALCDMGGWHLM